MGVKQKLGELVNIINTLDGDNSQLDEIVWDLLLEIDYNNLDYIHYYSSTIKLEYDDFVNVWYNFIKKNILEVPEEKIMDMQLEPVKSSLRISLFANELSQDLETLFNMHKPIGNAYSIVSSRRGYFLRIQSVTNEVHEIKITLNESATLIGNHEFDVVEQTR